MKIVREKEITLINDRGNENIDHDREVRETLRNFWIGQQQVPWGITTSRSSLAAIESV